MIYKISIDGITCERCAQKIREALEKLDGATVHKVSPEEKVALLAAEAEIPEEVLRATVSGSSADGEYTVTDIETEWADCCCTGKHKVRDAQEQKDLMNRLRRIEGQVRGVEKMLDDGVYCTDILTQVAAVHAALNSFNKVLLANHIRTCVADNIRSGNDEVIDELVQLLQKLMK